MNLLQKARSLKRLINRFPISTTSKYLRYCDNKRQQQPNNLFFQSRFTFFFKKQKYHEECIKKNEIYPPDYQIDSDDLMAKFHEDINEKYEGLDIYNICIYYAQVFNKRLENDKAVKVLQIAIENEQIKQFSFYDYNNILTYQMRVYFEMGNVFESQRTADIVYQNFIHYEQKNDITLINFLSEEMMVCNSIETSLRLCSFAIQFIDNKQHIPCSPQEQFRSYFLYAMGQYIIGEYKEAIQYSLLMCKQVKEGSIKIRNPENPFKIAFVSSMALGKIEQANQILEELKKYPDVNIEKLNLKEYHPINILGKGNNQIAEILNIQKKEKEIQIQLEKKGRNMIWNEEKDQRLLAYLSLKKYKEGLQYYREIYQKMGDELDWLNRIQLTHRISMFLSYELKFEEIIEIQQQNLSVLLKKRNYLLMNDPATIECIYYLVTSYQYLQQFDKALELHKKQHSLLFTNKEFNEFHQTVIYNFVLYAECMMELNMFNEALDFIKLIETYLNYHQLEEEYNISLFTVKKMQIKLLTLTENPQAKDILFQLCDFMKSIDTNKLNLQEEFYQSLLLAVTSSLKAKDETGVINYGDKYLELRSTYEKQEENLELRSNIYKILIKFYTKQNQFEQVDRLINEAQVVLIELKQYKDLLIIILEQIKSKISQDKLNEIENNLKLANQILDYELKNNPENQEFRSRVAFIESMVHLSKQEYLECLNKFELFMSFGLAHKLYQQEQITLVSKLENIPQIQQEVVDIIHKYQSKYQQ